MKNIFKNVMLVSLLVLIFHPQLEAKTAENKKIRKAIIQESIQDYPGPCACPYNQARNGSKCGKRSAWSRDGGYSPICYDNEVSAQMLKDWKVRNTSSTGSKSKTSGNI